MSHALATVLHRGRKAASNIMSACLASSREARRETVDQRGCTLSGSASTAQRLEATDTLQRVIRLENVSKRYPGADIDVLAGIDLTIGARDFVSIVGRSGSGKTTLLNLIGGLDSAYDGAIEVDGKDVCSFTDVELSELRNRMVGHVFQAYHLLDHLTCRENVSVAALFARGEMRRDASWVRRRAEEVLATVGLDGAGRRRPSTLSGGERQRVALARALFHQPAILLCDEPTGNLDVETGREIVELLTDLHRNGDMTIIAATHDEMISAAGARVLRLREGRFVDPEGGGE
jgi:putative ABC transport system ATP-binding protein